LKSAFGHSISLTSKADESMGRLAERYNGNSYYDSNSVRSNLLNEVNSIIRPTLNG
jgi:hypothetical protein